ncbi:class I SAM-dependent methyltransferase [Catellatospora citrea]|uniref:Methyltransferase n=1 Tax=Catellatospora citrea TaxID=53366 RepID=A0A8J3NXN4_9ACTN|nr:class I SAM-dependent methyltransferase [Catellatospora citrea]RKE12823.1 methyltransferase family protein [Catellatospora citrea]GIF95936.1 methyltransferase [Catellatospora citrea]
MGTTTAAYDAHADWYNDFMSPAAGDYLRRVHNTLTDLLGPGDGSCLDVGCGTGAHVPPVADLGWTPLGVDLSAGQLRHAMHRLPVAVADAARLPFADNTLPAAVCVLISTDVPDYGAVIAEVGRVLRPGGRFVHLGVHPCFVGAFADWSDRPRVVVDERYTDRSHTYDTWNPHGVRARVGGWQIPLADLLNAATTAGLRLDRVAESGTGIPDLFGFAAVKA